MFVFITFQILNHAEHEVDFLLPEVNLALHATQIVFQFFGFVI